MITDQRFLEVFGRLSSWRVAGVYTETQLENQYQGVANPAELPENFWIDLEKLKYWVNNSAPDVADAGAEGWFLTPIGMPRPAFLAVENIETGNWILLEHRPFGAVPWLLGVGFIAASGVLLLKTVN